MAGTDALAIFAQAPYVFYGRNNWMSISTSHTTIPCYELFWCFCLSLLHSIYMSSRPEMHDHPKLSLHWCCDQFGCLDNSLLHLKHMALEQDLYKHPNLAQHHIAYFKSILEDKLNAQMRLVCKCKLYGYLHINLIPSTNTSSSVTLVTLGWLVGCPDESYMQSPMEPAVAS